MQASKEDMGELLEQLGTWGYCPVTQKREKTDKFDTQKFKKTTIKTPYTWQNKKKQQQQKTIINKDKRQTRKNICNFCQTKGSSPQYIKSF